MIERLVETVDKSLRNTISQEKVNLSLVLAYGSLAPADYQRYRENLAYYSLLERVLDVTR